jgi:SAM-dependent methyltransferase
VPRYRLTSPWTVGHRAPDPADGAERILDPDSSAGGGPHLSSFADHFSELAASYATYRPHYPRGLFGQLAALTPNRTLAWDCATGTGQAAVPLADWFDQVLATDASSAQIGSAEPNPRVTYRVAPADASGLPDHSAGLVTVAQSLHWLDLPAFYAEVRRVLLPGGMLAVWTYGRPRIDAGVVDDLVAEFYERIVGPYWPPQRRWVEEGYRTLPFPFDEVPVAAPAMTASWSLAQLLGYLGTWSAVTRYTAATGTDPLPSLCDRLVAQWGRPERARRIEWPLSIRAGR